MVATVPGRLPLGEPDIGPDTLAKDLPNRALPTVIGLWAVPVYAVSMAFVFLFLIGYGNGPGVVWVLSFLGVGMALVALVVALVILPRMPTTVRYSTSGVVLGRALWPVTKRGIIPEGSVVPYHTIVKVRTGFAPGFKAVGLGLPDGGLVNIYLTRANARLLADRVGPRD